MEAPRIKFRWYQRGNPIQEVTSQSLSGGQAGATSSVAPAGETASMSERHSGDRDSAAGFLGFWGRVGFEGTAQGKRLRGFDSRQQRERLSSNHKILWRLLTQSVDGWLTQDDPRRRPVWPDEELVAKATSTHVRAQTQTTTSQAKSLPTESTDTVSRYNLNICKHSWQEASRAPDLRILWMRRSPNPWPKRASSWQRLRTCVRLPRRAVAVLRRACTQGGS